MISPRGLTLAFAAAAADVVGASLITRTAERILFALADLALSSVGGH